MKDTDVAGREGTPVAPPRTIRLILVALGLAGWFGTQYLLGQRGFPDDGRIRDGLFDVSEPIHSYLWTNRGVAHGLLIASSATIDALGIFLLAWSVVGPSIRPFLGLLILFGLRQILQLLCALPPPDGMIWEDPGVYSLLVTYSVSNDLFFSGHTAISVYGAVELARLGRPILVVLGVLIALFQAIVVIFLRAHYTMDVFAGAVTALFVAGLAARLAPAVDRAVAHAFGKEKP